MMGWFRRTAWQIIIQSVLLTFLIKTEVLSPAKGWLDTIIVSVLLAVVVRVIARVLGG